MSCNYVIDVITVLQNKPVFIDPSKINSISVPSVLLGLLAMT